MLLAPIVEIFCEIDDFCKWYEKKKIPKKITLYKSKKTRNRAKKMTQSEIVTILTLFHLSHYRTFKDFYLSCLRKDLAGFFPIAVSYTRFLELTGRALEVLTAYVLSKVGQKTHLYYIDSTKLVVCHNRRISGHKVFKGIAQRGYSSVGYFYGFKLHIAINHKGELMSFCVTRGNESDLNVASKLSRGLIGILAS
jgi:hypothetical protein